MSDLFDIKLIIDETCSNLSVTIRNNEHNEDVEGIIAAVQGYASRKLPMIPVYFSENVTLLPQKQIVRLYVSGQKVFAQTEDKTYEIRKSLREIEEILDKGCFVRISQSDIINIRNVKRFNFSGAGTIGVELDNGVNTFVARRRIKAVKEVLCKGENNGYKE